MTAAVGRFLVVAALAVTGCGGDGGPDTQAPATTPVETEQTEADVQSLTREERSLLARSEARIAEYCRRYALTLSGRKPPTAREQAEAFEAADRLIGLAQAKPAAESQTGVDVRLKLGDIAENLQGSNCDSSLVEQIDRGLAGVPAP